MNGIYVLGRQLFKKRQVLGVQWITMQRFEVVTQWWSALSLRIKR